MKICVKCKKEKSIDNFYKNRISTDRLTIKCKDCCDFGRPTTFNLGKEGFKFCSKCHIEKAKAEFSKDKHRPDGLTCQCRDCQYPNRIIKPNIPEGYRICTKCQILKQENKENFTLSFSKRDNKHRFNPKCKICDNLRRKTHRLNNLEQAKQSNRRWRAENRELANKIQNDNFKRRMRTDPIFRARRLISDSIRKAIKRNYGGKKSPTWAKLPYTPEQFKSHIESLWEPWMNWDNHGQYKTTHKTWQIDHIIPQRDLPYDSLDHPNFLKCWDLSNLRPLETIENIGIRNRKYQ